MTLEEKHKATIAECLAALRQIVDTHEIEAAKYLALAAIKTCHVIAREGRVPTVEESKDFLDELRAAED